MNQREHKGQKKNEKKNFYRQNKKEKDKAKENPENSDEENTKKKVQIMKIKNNQIVICMYYQINFIVVIIQK